MRFCKQVLPVGLLALTAYANDPCVSPRSITYDSQGNTLRTTSTGRTYIVHTAPGYRSDHTTPRPVILSFHGSGVDAEFQQVFSNLSHPSHRIDGRDIITVYPQGLVGLRKPCWPDKPPKRAWQGAPFSAPGVDDVRPSSN